MKITTNTSVSISLVIILIGGVLWLTDVSATGKINKLELQNQKTLFLKVDDKLDEVIERLSRIEGKIESD